MSDRSLADCDSGEEVIHERPPVRTDGGQQGYGIVNIVGRAMHLVSAQAEGAGEALEAGRGLPICAPGYVMAGASPTHLAGLGEEPRYEGAIKSGIVGNQETALRQEAPHLVIVEAAAVQHLHGETVNPGCSRAYGDARLA